MPLIRVALQFRKFRGTARSQVALARGARFSIGVSDLENAAALAMHARVIVALSGVAPIDHERAAIGSGVEVQPAKPRVRGAEEIWIVFPDIAAALALETVHVDAQTMHVHRVELV